MERIGSSKRIVSTVGSSGQSIINQSINSRDEQHAMSGDDDDDDDDEWWRECGVATYWVRRESV